MSGPNNNEQVEKQSASVGAEAGSISANAVLDLSASGLAEAKAAFKTNDTGLPSEFGTGGNMIIDFGSDKKSTSAFDLDAKPVDPFEQVGENDEKGLGWLWEQGKRLLGGGETLDDKLKEKAYNDLDHNEKTEYDKQLDQYNADRLRWMTQANIAGADDMPTRDKYPALAAYDKKVEELKQDIIKQVQSEMTPDQKRALADGYKEYMKQLEDYNKSFNPMGTGDYRMPPKPPEGGAVAKYLKAIHDKTEQLV